MQAINDASNGNFEATRNYVLHYVSVLIGVQVLRNPKPLHGFPQNPGVMHAAAQVEGFPGNNALQGKNPFVFDVGDYINI